MPLRGARDGTARDTRTVRGRIRYPPLRDEGPPIGSRGGPGRDQ